ncbi:MAG: pyrimidine 5'-nucleotidase [Pseudomonadota bacterium]
MTDRALASDFAHVDTWVFDLDNTLYSPQARLFDQIEARMRGFISRRFGYSLGQADALRETYWREHGTTLAGLMANHDVDPMEFLHDVHDIDFSKLSAAPHLAARIAALPGRKIVYTNGDRKYAARVLAARGLSAPFEAIYGIEDAGFVPKPKEAAFAAVFGKDGLTGQRAAMFEDDPRNLEVPEALGLRTVLVHTKTGPQSHIHHRTTDLARFLSQITG